jgi:hypothetical protein
MLDWLLRSRADLGALNLHLETVDGSVGFRTKSTDQRLLTGAASLAIRALIDSVVALADICQLEFNHGAAQELIDLTGGLCAEESAGEGDLA